MYSKNDKLQVTNSNTTQIKVLDDLNLTVLKYFTLTVIRLKEAPNRHASEKQETRVF